MNIPKTNFTGLFHSRHAWTVMALFFILLVNLVISPEFFQLQVKDGRLYGSVIDVLNRSAPVALLAIGMSLVIATGGIDLSVGAVIAICGAVCANLLNSSWDAFGIVFVLGLSSGLAAGFINGSLVGFFGIQPIIATLVLMVTGRGIAQLINDGQIITFHNDAFAFIGTGHLLGLPVPVVIVVVTLLSLGLLLRYTALSLYIEATGYNQKASYYAGIPVNRVKFMVYCISGMCAAMAGMIITADIQGADANNAGLWLELDAILAVVLGGASLMGGRFSLLYSVIGVLIIQSLSTTIIMSGVPPKYNLLIKALVILTVLLLQSGIFKQQLKRLVAGRAG